MRENIYIRKENEKFWKDLSDKSAWVNDRLQQSFNHGEVIDLPPVPKNPAPSSEKWTGPIFRDKKNNKL